MFIDLHVHTARFSSCSKIELEDAILRAKQIGLDGLCVTDHESNGIKDQALELASKHDFLVLVGTEILTHEGDILVFGMEDVPHGKMHTQDLISLVSAHGGVTIAAHPFRDNGRGMGDQVRCVKGLNAVEVLNGNTSVLHNNMAHELAADLAMPMVGASDAHRVEQVGCYATFFRNHVANVYDLITSIRQGCIHPVIFNPQSKEFEPISE